MTTQADGGARITIDIVSEFLGAIFGNAEQPIFFQTLANDAGDVDEAPNKQKVLTRDIDAIGRFIARHDRNRRGLFFCVSTIALGSPTRNKENSAEICTAHTDLDFRSIVEDEPAIRQIADTLSKPPSSIVFSGGGLHLYWFLKEPLDAQTYRERIEALNRKIAIMLAGDGAAVDVCRLMRLPGTTNSKYGDQRKATVEKLDAAARYDLGELEEWVAEARPLLTPRVAPTKSGKGMGAGKNGRANYTLHGQSRNDKDKTGTEIDDLSPYPSNPYLAVAEEQGWKPPLDVEQMLADMVYPGNVHDTQIRVSASMLKAGWDLDDVVDILVCSTRVAAGVAGKGWDWRAEERGIREACDSAIKKFDIPAPDIRGTSAGDTRGPAGLGVTLTLSRETPDRTDETAGKGAPIGAADSASASDNVVQLVQKRPRKAAPKTNMAHIVLARAVMEVLGSNGYRLMFTETGPYAYEADFWCRRKRDDLKEQLDAELEKGAQGMGLESTTRLINEARNYIIRAPELQGRGTLFDRHGKVPTMNGLIDPATGELEPAKPEHYCTWRIPYEYDPAATCPYWLQMLEDTFADRPPAVRAEYVQLLQEWLGMSLLDRRAKALSCILFLQGASDYGKSELIDVLAGLFGPRRNTTPIDMLDKTHGLMAFADRYPWVLPEAFDQGKWHFSSVTKALASGEPIQINMKSDRIFDHTFTGPIIWGANNDPQFKENTAAITNRLLIVPCLRKFDVLEPVGVAITARAAGLDKPSQLVLRDEMPGVLVWAVQGLLRAKARGYFLRPDESRTAAANVRRDSNMAIGFVDDCVVFDPDSMVSVPDFAAAFASWWAEGKGSERGVPGSESVSKALKAMAEHRIAFDLRDMHRRYYAGIRLNTEGRRYWSNAVTSDAFVFQSRKASTTESGGNPNRAIPPEWDGKGVIDAMRAAHRKSMLVPMTVFPGDVPLPHDSRELSSDLSGALSSTELPDPPDDIPF